MKKIFIFIVCCLVFSLASILFYEFIQTIDVDKTIPTFDESISGSYANVEMNEGGKLSIDLFVLKEDAPVFASNDEKFLNYVNMVIKSMQLNADEDVVKLKKFSAQDNYYYINVSTRRINAKNNPQWGWFDFGHSSKFLYEESDFSSTFDNLDQGKYKSKPLVFDTMMPGRITFRNDVCGPKNQAVRVLTDSIIEPLDLYYENQDQDNNDYFAYFNIPNIDFLTQINLTVPGKIKYYSNACIELVSNNQIILKPIKIKTQSIIGYEYELDSNNDLIINDESKSEIDKYKIKEKVSVGEEINCFVGYFTYTTKIAVIWIVFFAILGTLLLVSLLYLVVSGKLKRFFTSKTAYNIKNNKMLYFMIIPAVILAIIFCYIPMFGVIIAFEEYDYQDGFFFSEWVGMRNFINIFNPKDPAVFHVFRNTLYISIIRVATNFPAILIMALMVNEIESQRVKGVVRTISYLPNFISWIAIGGMFFNILDPNNGILNTVISLFTGEETHINWYIDNEDTKRWWWILALASLWKSLGWGTIIYMSGFASINQELYDACKIDGGGRFRQITTVTLPGISNIIMLQLIMDMGNLIRDNYEQVLSLSRGSANSSTTYIVGALTYSAITGSGTGYSFATAISLVQGAIGLALVIMTNRIAKKTDREGIM